MISYALGKRIKSITYLCISGTWKTYISCFLGIYLLNLFLAFLTPKFDPSIELDTQENEMEEGPALPTKADEEFKPFIRRLPEFKFWYVWKRRSRIHCCLHCFHFRYSATKATVIAIVCSFFSIFDIPVFWPILLVYFCILFAITMRRQIKHMIKYRYIPFDWGKKNYGPSSSRSRWSTHLFSLWIAYKCIITAADIGMSIHRYNKTYKYSKVYCYIMDHAEHRLFAEKCQCQFTVIWLFLP